MTQDCHAALRTEIISDIRRKGFHYKVVRLKRAKGSFVDTLHVRPTVYTTAGFQRTDFLSIIGFSRSRCAFHGGECFCRHVDAELPLEAVAVAMEKAFQAFVSATKQFEGCGIFIDQPQGWNFFLPEAPRGKHSLVSHHAVGDGHTSPISKQMKEAEDEYFRYVLTWIEGGPDKGWVIHYRPKAWPVSREFDAAFRFLPGFRTFGDCPEFDFSACFWRFIRWEPEHEASMSHRSADQAHRWFAAHQDRFSRGLDLLLSAHELLDRFGFSFLALVKESASSDLPSATYPSPGDAQTPEVGGGFDVAISFAGPERSLARTLAERVKAAGYRVFYDEFYQEDLWGQNLVEVFDKIYRKSSRYCVIFISEEYSQRMWTILERRNAQARALAEKGQEYILPVRVEDIELPGLLPTVGYLSLRDHSIEEIAEILVRKLRAADVTSGGTSEEGGSR